jgi:hypothetical protein
VFDLQPGVHLQEVEGMFVGDVQELRGACPLVTDGQREPAGGVLQLLDLLGRQHR